MKLALYRFVGVTRLGVPVGDQLVDLTRGAEWLLQSRGAPRAAAQAAVVLPPPSAVDFLAGGRDSLALAREVLSAIAQAEPAELERAGIVAPAADVEYLPTLLGALAAVAGR